MTPERLAELREAATHYARNYANSQHCLAANAELLWLLDRAAETEQLRQENALHEATADEAATVYHENERLRAEVTRLRGSLDFLATMAERVQGTCDADDRTNLETAIRAARERLGKEERP